MIPYLAQLSSSPALNVASTEFLSILALSALLILKIVTTDHRRPYLQRLNRILNIAIVPLLIVFLVTTVFKLVEVAA